jgi:hypothetical protein
VYRDCFTLLYFNFISCRKGQYSSAPRNYPDIYFDGMTKLTSYMSETAPGIAIKVGIAGQYKKAVGTI